MIWLPILLTFLFVTALVMAWKEITRETERLVTVWEDAYEERNS